MWRERNVAIKPIYVKASNHARYNRKALENCNLCGCYYCISIFSTNLIEEWCYELDDDEAVTAICPQCGIDSVLPENCGYPFTLQFLSEMNKVWFEK